ALWQAIAGHEIFVISDEVYEHINFSQQGHASVLAHPQLRERAVAVSSSLMTKISCPAIACHKAAKSACCQI
ncbi:hypothetical protein ACUOFC_68115, partial [Escherichia sp. TWPC-MK]